MDFSHLAAVSGKGVLFKVIQPARAGLILESLDDEKKRMVATVNNKVSILSEISIYTTDEQGSTPLSEVMKKIHTEFNGETDLNKNSSPEELKSFLKFILPNYDESRVYVSDIKKLVSWYGQIVSRTPDVLSEEKVGDGVNGQVGEEKETADE